MADYFDIEADLKALAAMQRQGANKISPADLIEMCAKVCDERAKRRFPWASENADVYNAQVDEAEAIAAAIRALIPQHGDGVVCDATPVYLPQHRDEFDVLVPLYRAKEPTK